MSQLVKNLSAMWDTWFQYLCWQEMLEKGKVPTPVFWHGEFHGLYRPWSCKESDMTFLPRNVESLPVFRSFLFLMVNFCSLLQTGFELFLFKFILREYNFFFSPSHGKYIIFSIQQRFAESQPYQSLMET